MDDRNIAILRCMVSRAEKILTYCEGTSKEDFLDDEELQEQCAFNFIQIGEYVSSLDDEFIDLYDTIPWHKIRGLRHRIVHDYEGIDLIMIWETICFNLPELIEQLNKIIGDV